MDEQLWDLASELSDVNSNLRRESLYAHQAEHLPSPLQTCLALDEKFELWEATVSSEALPFTLDIDLEATEFGAQYNFSSDSTGYTMIYYLGFRLLLADIVLRIIDHILNNGTLDSQCLNPSELEPGLRAPATLAYMRRHFEGTRQRYAEHVMRSSPFALDAKAGHYVAYRMSFGILLALYAFQKSMNLVGIAAASEALRVLAEDKGLSFAHAALGKMRSIMYGGLQRGRLVPYLLWA